MKKIVLPLCLLLSFAASSQNNFEKGYVVTTAGDTTSGLLKHNTYSELSRSVEFKAGDANAAAVRYSSHELASFGFDKGDLFRAVTYTDAADSNKRKTEFARVALEGYYDMYVLARGLLFNYLIKGTDTSYLLYDDRVDLQEQKVYLGNYRNMLAFLGRDCGLLLSDFEKVAFTHVEIARIMRFVNTSHKSESIERRTKAKLETHVVVHAGGFKLKDAGSQLSGGLELRLRNKNLSRKLNFVTGLHYSKTVEVAKKQSYYYGVAIKKETTTEVYSIPVTVHYTLLEKVVQPYIYAGFGAAYRNMNFKGLSEDGKKVLGKYGLSIIGGLGVEVYPLPYLAIKADWRYELLMQHPTLGVLFRF